MLNEAVDFLAEIEERGSPRWISFLGNSGTGKTFLADMLCRQSMRYPQIAQHKELVNGAQIAFWPKLLTKLRNGDYWLIEDLAIANLVFLDEIAVEHDPSGFARDKLCELISRRVGKWTIITSNLTLKKLADIDTRISSRMIRGGSRTIEVDTVDYALRKRVDASYAI